MTLEEFLSHCSTAPPEAMTVLLTACRYKGVDGLDALGELLTEDERGDLIDGAKTFADEIAMLKGRGR